MNIYEINLYLIANFMYLHYYGKLPETFDNYFVKNDSIHSYNTRSSRSALKGLKSSNTFKKALHTHVKSAKNTL